MKIIEKDKMDEFYITNDFKDVIKVGDIVKHEYDPSFGVGEVIGVRSDKSIIAVRLLDGVVKYFRTSLPDNPAGVFSIKREIDEPMRVSRFKEWKNGKFVKESINSNDYEIGDRFECLSNIVFFKVGSIGELVEIHYIKRDDIILYNVMNVKTGLRCPMIKEVLDEAFKKIGKAKRLFTQEDPYGEEDWIN